MGRAAGVAVHRVLQLWDLQDREALRCVSKEILSGVVAQFSVTELDLRVAVEEILGDLLESGLAEEMQNLEVVGREIPFECAYQGVLVRGVIDLLAKRGTEWVIVDFKTDRVAGAELGAWTQRYVPQMGSYAQAVKSSLGLDAPPKCELWALRAGKILPLEPSAACLDF